MTIEAEAVRQRPRRRRKAAAAVAVIVLGLAVAAFGWHTLEDTLTGPDASAPSCSWPAHVERADAAQDGLIRCYLRAVAHRSTSGLESVVRAPSDGGPIGFDSNAFDHAADALSGTATVTVIGNVNDSADATVAIRYADEARDNLEIHLADPASAVSWRFWNLGIDPPDPKAPPHVTQ